jgi:hypothetical protein
MMQLEELVAVLEGANVAVVADDEYSAATFLCNFINTDIIKRMILVVYSEIKCKKIKKVLKSKHELWNSKSLERVPVVKVGKTDEVGFGDTIAYIEGSGDLKDIFSEVGAILKKLNAHESKAAVFVGFELASYLYDPVKITYAIEELFAYVPDMTKYFILSQVKSEYHPLISNIFDVVIRIKRSQDFDVMSYSRTYDVYIEHSIVGNLPPIPLCRIDGDSLVDIL